MSPRRHFLHPLVSHPERTFRLVNASRTIVLADQVERAFDSASRKKGLLGRTSLDHRHTLAIAPTNAIHTFAMQFPIDVLFVRRDGEVVKKVTALPRRRIAFAVRAFAVLEFGASHPGVQRTEVGDRLELQESSG